MIRFGVIGTNFITEKFIEAGNQHNGFRLTAVYSRSENKAQDFAASHGATHTFTSIEKMVESGEVDAVYIASPNALHAEQAKICMKNGKHVLCEKSMASNVREVKEMIETAQENDVLLMEAVKSTLMPGFVTLQSHLHKIGKIRRYVGNFCKYSSRYDAYKDGTVLNAFNPELSNGSLMDLGVYGIYPMVVLFGEPLSMKANGVRLESGVDGEGSLLAGYDEMEGVVMHSKIVHSYSPSEIQGEEGSVIIPNISEPQNIYIRYNDGREEQIDTEADSFAPMYYEVEEFIQLIEQGKTESNVNSLHHSLAVARILEEARNQMGIKYPADRS